MKELFINLVTTEIILGVGISMAMAYVLLIKDKKELIWFLLKIMI